MLLFLCTLLLNMPLLSYSDCCSPLLPLRCFAFCSHCESVFVTPPSVLCTLLLNMPLLSYADCCSPLLPLRCFAFCSHCESVFVTPPSTPLSSGKTQSRGQKLAATKAAAAAANSPTKKKQHTRSNPSSPASPKKRHTRSNPSSPVSPKKPSSSPDLGQRPAALPLRESVPPAGVQRRRRRLDSSSEDETGPSEDKGKSQTQKKELATKKKPSDRSPSPTEESSSVKKALHSKQKSTARSPSPTEEPSPAKRRNRKQKSSARSPSPTEESSSAKRRNRKHLDSSSDDDTALSQAHVKSPRRTSPEKLSSSNKFYGGDVGKTPTPKRNKRRRGEDNDGEDYDDDSDTATSPQDAVEVAAIICATKHAVNDIEPHEDKIPPFMYWKKDGRDCARRLFKRSKTLRRMANHHKDPKHYPHKYAKLVRNTANAEMNAQIRNLRELYICNQFPEFQLVKNCLTADQKNGPLMLSPGMSVVFKDVEELMTRLASNNMYTSEALYDTFCRGIESGKLRDVPIRRPTPLQTMTTIAHEAHFRWEISECMTRQGFRWGLGPANVEQREKGFQEMCERVAEDRQNNADTAWTKRLQSLGPEDRDSNDSSSDDEQDSKKGVTVNSKFY